MHVITMKMLKIQKWRCPSCFRDSERPKLGDFEKNSLLLVYFYPKQVMFTNDCRLLSTNRLGKYFKPPKDYLET